jgi:hypothetical protein
MKKLYKLFVITSMIFSLQNDVFGQTEYGDYQKNSNHNLDIINNRPWQDLRIRKAGTKVIGLMTFIPINAPTDNIDLINGVVINVDTKYRLTEQLTPNVKRYISDKNVVGFGLFYKRISQSARGTIDTSAAQDLLPIKKYISRGQGTFLRGSFDHHFSAIRYKKFDVDFYSGASLCLGFTPVKDINNQSNSNGDFINVKTTTRNFGIGGDLYGGINLQFNRWSFGAELLAFGVDINKGFGKQNVDSESNIAGVSKKESYSTYEAKQYTEISVSKSLVSMYRGVRLQVSYYF